MSAVIAPHSTADAWEPGVQPLRAATAAAEQRLAGRPPWKMSQQEQMQLAGLAADYLRARGAARVRLFGSLARGRAPGVQSDFDLAVEGLPPGAFLGCVGTLLQLLPLPVDLVELESASPLLRQRIMREGIAL